MVQGVANGSEPVQMWDSLHQRECPAYKISLLVTWRDHQVSGPPKRPWSDHYSIQI